MRILSWNINGIRTLPQYHPWNTLGSCEAILEHLEADIICFQELKTTRAALDKKIGIPGAYDSFFSFPTSKGGYSGVAVYSNSRSAIPLKAEEGLSGTLQPKPPLSSEERISSSYAFAHEIEMVPDEEGNTPSNLVALDAEGRALVLDFGLFVLINLYCPNETSDARLPFKMNYHLMLQERVRKLIDEGREVIVLGDINICASPLDHGEGHLASRVDGFFEHPARAWFRRWLHPDSGRVIDVVRSFWPDRKGMYTCWNTKISARESNYGTRVDYILVTPGLLPWVKHGDIQPSLKGSDHCPIYIDLYDEIVLGCGSKLTIRDAMHMDGARREPPRLAAKFWDEFSGKQTLLSTFFGKRSNVTPLPEVLSQAAMVAPPPSQAKNSGQSTPPDIELVDAESSSFTSSSTSTTCLIADTSRAASSRSKIPKRKLSDTTVPAKSKKQKGKQPNLSTFFSKPSTSRKTVKSNNSPVVEDIQRNGRADLGIPEVDNLSQLDSDYQLALQLTASQEKILSSSRGTSSSSMMSTAQGKAAWSHLLAPIQPPKCTVHQEPAKEFTVNKPGPNKGKNFFICSRPVGAGYDKGKSERLREEVDPQYRCNFFKWSSDVKRESLRPSTK